MVEEIIKALSENPELALTGAGALYSAATYAAGRMHVYETTREAEDALEDGYNSPFDVLKGFYDKGKMDAAEKDINSKRRDPYPEPSFLESDEDIAHHLEEGTERTPIRGD